MEKNIFIIILVILLLISSIVIISILYFPYNLDKYIYFDRNNNFGYSSWCRNNICVDENNQPIYVISFTNIRKESY